jgi:hypothetical protein
MRATLRFLLELEAVFLRRHRLPFGLSLFVLAGRRED